MIEALFFYLFAGVMLASSFMVVVSRNPVYSVLFLILAFFNAAGLFVLIGAEFLAMLLVVVYVGAVAVLFLFVVMMLDINFAEMRAGFQKYLPLGLAVGGILVFELVAAMYGDAFSGSQLPDLPDVANTTRLGGVLYTKYAYLFQLAGLILLVAMIGAIALTMRKRVGVRRQSIAAQNSRRREDVLEIVKMPAGTRQTADDDAAEAGRTGRRSTHCAPCRWARCCLRSTSCGRTAPLACWCCLAAAARLCRQCDTSAPAQRGCSGERGVVGKGGALGLGRLWGCRPREAQAAGRSSG